MLCASCRKLIVPAKIDRKILKTRLIILVHQSEEIERVLMKILRFGDLQAAAALMESLPDCHTLFRRYPVRILDSRIENQQDVFEAFFGKRAVYDQVMLEKKLARKDPESRRSRQYLALSFTGLSSSSIEACLTDPDCAVLLIVAQKGNFNARTIRTQFGSHA